MKNNANWSDSGSSGGRQARVPDITMKKHLSLLHDAPPAPGAPLGAPLTRRVVFVLIDALREDTSLKPDVMPFLNELRGRSAAATIHSRPPSYSQPGYSTLLTGAWP